MSHTVLERLCTERDEVRNAAIALAEAEEFNPEDKTFAELQNRAGELDRRVASLADLMDARAAADTLDGKLARSVQRREQRVQEPETRSTWGEAFVRSQEYTEYRGRGTSSQFFMDDLQSRALPTGLSDMVAAGFKGMPTRVDTTPPVVPTPLMDSITQIQVGGNAIEFVAWTKKAGGATKVAEKAAKPSAEWGPTVTSTTLDTYAVYTQLTRQLIEDEAAVRSTIDQELRRDVDRAVEADAAAVLAAATASIPDALKTGDLLGAIRVGMGTVMTAGYTPTAVLLNPADWAALDMVIFNATANGPTVGQQFWGLRPIPSSAQAAGTAVVGDFRTAITHYFRQQVALYVTDSHADTFLANVFTLLAEKRGKTAVVRPQALCEAKTA